MTPRVRALHWMAAFLVGVGVGGLARGVTDHRFAHPPRPGSGNIHIKEKNEETGEKEKAKEEAQVSCNIYANASTGNDANPGTIGSPVKTLKKLVEKTTAGKVGCLQSEQKFATEAGTELQLGSGHVEVKGNPGEPITIASTNSNQPAFIEHPITLFHGADYITFTHLHLRWLNPTPQSCWNAEGNTIEGKIIKEPTWGVCEAGTPNEERHVQVSVVAAHDMFLYDDVTTEQTGICFNLVEYPGSSGFRAEFMTIEHSRIHDCGPPVRSESENGFTHVNEEPGWHDHGIYDYGNEGVFKNNYIYANSRNGVLFYPSGKASVLEHNVIDGNGAGVQFAANKNETVKWNIITNSNSPRKSTDYGADGVSSTGSGNVLEKNAFFNNLSGEIEKGLCESEGGKVKCAANLLKEPPGYYSTAKHEYELSPSSKLLGLGYGVESQPISH